MDCVCVRVEMSLDFVRPHAVAEQEKKNNTQLPSLRRFDSLTLVPSITNVTPCPYTVITPLIAGCVLINCRFQNVSSRYQFTFN